MKYHIFTYGCQMNKSDSEKIANRLEAMGHKPVSQADLSAGVLTREEILARADIIVVNFCSVRQSAVHRALAQLQKYKNKKLIAAGCLLPEDREKLTARNIKVWRPDDYFTTPPLQKNKFSVFIPIMTGCDNFCSYCAVPYTRGREKSRPALEILNEIKQALKNGAKEIILLGQNVNSYRDVSSLRATAKQSGDIAAVHGIAASSRDSGTPRNDYVDFPFLLQKTNSLPGQFRLSFITSHPKDMSGELIETCAKCDKVSPYIHLPVQSGDDKILRAMNRHYSVAHYKNLVKKLRSTFKKYRPSFPHLAISTDIIVGFPGETKKQFQNTLKLMKDVKFDMIYFARYSPRSGTAAARLKDSVSPAEKRRRAQAINSLLKKQALALNKKYLNKKIEVLAEKIDDGYAYGKTATNKDVKITLKRHPELAAGSIVTVKILDVTAWGLNAVTADSR